ncbi:MAG: hypothetical protein N3G19_01370 [Candidatus Pacearchaeota archaeon]|nr:hypothetical protein [Candidatus Pacearchaeota archaeon]
MLRKQLSELIKGKAVMMPLYSFKLNTRVGYKKTSPKKMIVEGIFALHDPEINSLAKLKLFVDTDSDIRFIRRLQRDLAKRGENLEKVIKRWLEMVKSMHDKFVEPTKKLAHIIIPEDPDGKMQGNRIDKNKDKKLVEIIYLLYFFPINFLYLALALCDSSAISKIPSSSAVL